MNILHKTAINKRNNNKNKKTVQEYMKNLVPGNLKDQFKIQLLLTISEESCFEDI